MLGREWSETEEIREENHIKSKEEERIKTPKFQNLSNGHLVHLKRPILNMSWYFGEGWKGKLIWKLSFKMYDLAELCEINYMIMCFKKFCDGENQNFMKKSIHEKNCLIYFEILEIATSKDLTTRKDYCRHSCNLAGLLRGFEILFYCSGMINMSIL